MTATGYTSVLTSSHKALIDSEIIESIRSKVLQDHVSKNKNPAEVQRMSYNHL